MDDFDDYLNRLYANILSETRSKLMPEPVITHTLSLNSLSPSQRQKVLDTFLEVCHQQQGNAEFRSGAQGEAGNPAIFHARGTFTYLTEHLGDILNRMTTRNCDRIEFGYEAVREKVMRGLSFVRDGYGFDREIDEALTRNWKEAGEPVPFDKWKRDFGAARMLYVEAHRALPVYNEMQRLARQVAIDHGMRHSTSLETNLTKLMANLVDRDKWAFNASLVTLDPSGALLPL